MDHHNNDAKLRETFVHHRDHIILFFHLYALFHTVQSQQLEQQNRLFPRKIKRYKNRSFLWIFTSII
jgi:hypothetical protein